MCVCIPLAKIRRLPCTLCKKLKDKVCDGTGDWLGPVMAQGYMDYYMVSPDTHHATKRTRSGWNTPPQSPSQCSHPSHPLCVPLVI